MGYNPWGSQESDMTQDLNHHHWAIYRGFPGGLDDKESACSAGDLGSIPGLRRSPGMQGWQPTPVFLPGEPHGQRSLAGYSECTGRKESDATE